MFTSVYGQVDKYLALNQRQSEAVEDGWLPKPFSDTKSKVAGEMDKFLDKVLIQLVDDRLVAVKGEINRLTQENSQLALQIADWTMMRAGAADEKKFYEVWKTSCEELDQKIKSGRLQIIANTLKIADNKKLIGQLLAENGVKLSEAEVDSLLKTVTGDDVIASVAVLKNVHAIVARLQQIMGESEDNIHLAKKYYGLFLLSTEAYAHELDNFIKRIDEQYRPKLKEIQSANATLLAETKNLAKKDSKYLSNLRAQQITAEAAEAYHEVLSRQQKRLEERRREVAKILAYADNTYRTVNLAHSLYSTMNEGLASYQALMSLPMIEVIPFDNKDLELKFVELTKQMKE